MAVLQTFDSPHALPADLSILSGDVLNRTTTSGSWSDSDLPKAVISLLDRIGHSELFSLSLLENNIMST